MSSADTSPAPNACHDDARAPAVAGPILILDTIAQGQMQLAALFIAKRGEKLPPLRHPGGEIAPTLIAEYAKHNVFRARFTLPADSASSYDWNGETFHVAGGGGR